MKVKVLGAEGLGSKVQVKRVKVPKSVLKSIVADAKSGNEKNIKATLKPYLDKNKGIRV